jgi:hypothetical protein
MKKTYFVAIVAMGCFLLNGCASMALFAVGKEGLKVPQIVAYVQPVLRDNQINLRGKITIQNPTKTSLALEGIELTIKNEDGAVISQENLRWEMPVVESKDELDSPVSVILPLDVLGNRSLEVHVKTAFLYKTFRLRVPLESKIAVIDLAELKESLSRPLNVSIYTKLKSNLFGRSAIDYVLSLNNPLNVDLVLQDAMIGIYTSSSKVFAESRLADTVFTAAKSTQLKGTIEIGNILGKLSRSGFIFKPRLIKFSIRGRLCMAKTGILIPFRIDSVQEAKFSLFNL